MGRVVKMPKMVLPQEYLKALVPVLEMGQHQLLMLRQQEDEVLELLREGAIVEPGELDLEIVEEYALVRRVKVVKRRGQARIH